jgi:hypothetical protein
MNRRSLFLSFLVLVAFTFSSCSGYKGPATIVTPSNGTLILVLKANPPLPSSGLSLLSFSGSVTGVSLTPSTGVVSLLASPSFNVEFTRLTGDTYFLGTITAPASTYTSINITFGSHTATFCTQPTSGVAGCAGAITQVAGATGTTAIATSITINANQTSNLAIVADLGKAITANGQTITAVNLGAAGVFSTATLPGTSDLVSPQIAHVEDIFGTVTALNANTHSVTVLTSTHGTLTATQGSAATYDANHCSTQNFTCVVLNQVVSMDAIMNSDGTFTYTYFDPLFATSADFVEGIVTNQGNSVTNRFTIVTNDFYDAAVGSVIAGKLNLGDSVVVTLSNPAPFTIDNKGLFVPANSFSGGIDASVVQPGQTVLVHLTAFTAKNGTTPAAITSDGLALRFTRVTGSISTAGSPIFYVGSLPPVYGVTTSAQMESSATFTSLDGYAPPLVVSSADTISARALFFGPGLAPSFSAATVRKH